MKPTIVNINQADHNTLAQLPGIGPTLADRIIEYRETVGPFQSPSELSEIYGISEAMVNDIVPMLTISEEVEMDGGSGEVELAGEDEISDSSEEEIEDEAGENLEPMRPCSRRLRQMVIDKVDASFILVRDSRDEGALE